jgi:isoleucyl-tRNA synthetase
MKVVLVSSEVAPFSKTGGLGDVCGALAGALDTRIDDALAREGQLREIVNRVQNLRKSGGLAVSDRIRLRWSGGELTRAMIAEFGDRLAEETLAVDLVESGEGDGESYELGGEEVFLGIEKIR